MPNNNKNKGKAGERELCSILTEVFGGSWQRVPNSGAFVGGKNLDRIRQLSQSQILIHRGDIIPPDDMQNLVIECKTRKEFPFHQLLQDKTVIELDEWLEQVENDVINNELYFVAFKINNKGWFIVIPDIFFKHQLKSGYSVYKEKYIITELKTFLEMHKSWIMSWCK